jgi:hypothetical protein
MESTFDGFKWSTLEEASSVLPVAEAYLGTCTGSAIAAVDERNEQADVHAVIVRARSLV